jgi:uncharacterized protein (TIGR02145 family)
MKKRIFVITILILYGCINYAQTVTDADGNIYNTVQIGTQVWMKENLATTKYNNGTSIPLVTDSIAWFNLTTPGYCWYKNDSATNKNPYGALYNWYTVNTGNLCPTGWHVPSNAEWHTLVLFLDPSATDCYCTESAIAGNSLKEAGLVHWGTGNNGNNSSNFTAVGSGFRNYFNKSYQGKTAVTYLWTATPNSPYETAWHRWLSNNSSNVYEYLDKKNQAMSVRCIKDSSTNEEIHDFNNKNHINISPNPAENYININFTGENKMKILIYNTLGVCVMQKDISSSQNRIDITGLLNGLYITHFISNNVTTEFKFIKK